MTRCRTSLLVLKACSREVMEGESGSVLGGQGQGEQEAELVEHQGVGVPVVEGGDEHGQQVLVVNRVEAAVRLALHLLQHLLQLAVQELAPLGVLQGLFIYFDHVLKCLSVIFMFTLVVRGVLKRLVTVDAGVFLLLQFIDNLS